MFRGDSMKSLFIVLIIFSLFISGCELVEEKSPLLSYPSEDGPQSMQLDAGRHGNGIRYVPEKSGGCSSLTLEMGECVVSLTEGYSNFVCTGENEGLCDNVPGFPICGVPGELCDTFEGYYPDCECITEGGPVCGDTIINQDYEECDGGDLNGQSCADFGFNSGNLGCYGPGDSNGECTFDSSGCENVSHAECNGTECIEVEGFGNDMCTTDVDCGGVSSSNWMRAYPTQPFVWGGGVDYTTCQDECDNAGYGDCLASNGAFGQCEALVSGGDIIKGTVYNNILTGNMNSYDSCNQSLFNMTNNRNWCCCESAPETESFCGDAVIQNPNNEGISEICDTSDFGSNTCSSLGYEGGSLACETYNCRLDKSGCDATCRNADADGYYHNAVSHLGNQLHEVHHGTTWDGNNRAGSAQFSLSSGYYSFECSATKSKVSMYDGQLLGDGFWGPYPTEDNVLIDLAAECDCHYDYGAFEMPGPNVTYDNHYTTHDCARQTMGREILIYLPAGTYSIYVAPPSGVFAGSDLGSYGKLSESLVTCTGVVDCDDDDASIKPNAIENTANFKDDNCDGLIDVV
jgi:hypothetical protein